MSVFDTDRFLRKGDDWRFRGMRLKERLLAHEFDYALLRGELRDFKPRTREHARKTLLEHYPELTDRINDFDIWDLRNENPRTLALRKVAKELGIEPAALAIRLSPSGRRKASFPPELEAFLHGNPPR